MPTQMLVDMYVGDLCNQLASADTNSIMPDALDNIVYPNAGEKEAARARLATYLKRKGADEHTVRILSQPHPDDVKAARSTRSWPDRWERVFFSLVLLVARLLSRG